MDAIFEAISYCQQLYPDTELSSDSANEDETEPEGAYFSTAEGLQHLTLEGETVLSHLENILLQSQDYENG